MEKQFIALHEYNTKEKESFILFMQYTDNEENIKLLVEFILDADYEDMDGEYVRFEIDSNNLISEKTVDEMIKCGFGSYHDMFSKLSGKMKNPFYGEEDDEEYKNSIRNMNSYDKARLLDDKFYGIKLRKLFTLP